MMSRQSQTTTRPIAMIRRQSRQQSPKPTLWSNPNLWMGSTHMLIIILFLWLNLRHANNYTANISLFVNTKLDFWAKLALYSKKQTISSQHLKLFLKTIKCAKNDLRAHFSFFFSSKKKSYNFFVPRNKTPKNQVPEKMCFDVPWKTDLCRLRRYRMDHNDDESLCSLSCIWFVYQKFLNSFAPEVLTYPFVEQEVICRICLQAALYHIRNPEPSSYLLTQRHDDAKKDADQDAIMAMCRRFNEMQVALLKQVCDESAKDPNYFVQEMRQVCFFFNSKCKTCFLKKNLNFLFVAFFFQKKICVYSWPTSKTGSCWQSPFLMGFRNKRQLPKMTCMHSKASSHLSCWAVFKRTLTT